MHAIYCNQCERLIGGIAAPNADDIAKAAKDSPYAAMVGLLPANIAEVVAGMCSFTCPIHTMLGEEITDGGTQKDGEENDGQEAEPDPLAKDADERRHAEQRRRGIFGGFGG